MTRKDLATAAGVGVRDVARIEADASCDGEPFRKVLSALGMGLPVEAGVASTGPGGPVPRPLHAHLREMRLALGMTQRQAADAAGIDQTTVAMYESPRRRAVYSARDGAVGALLAAYGVGPEQLRERGLDLGPAPDAGAGAADGIPLHERLRSSRLARGLTQRQVAEVAGVDAATVAMYESQRRRPTRSAVDGAVASILAALGPGVDVPPRPARKTRAMAVGADHAARDMPRVGFALALSGLTATPADAVVEAFREWVQDRWRDPDGLARSWYQPMYSELARSRHDTVEGMREAVEAYWQALAPAIVELASMPDLGGDLRPARR